jgi:hypothetical protein
MGLEFEKSRAPLRVVNCAYPETTPRLAPNRWSRKRQIRNLNRSNVTFLKQTDGRVEYQLKASQALTKETKRTESPRLSPKLGRVSIFLLLRHRRSSELLQAVHAQAWGV